MEDLVKLIYVHLDYSKYSFSNTWDNHDHVSGHMPEYAQVSIRQSKKFFTDITILDESYAKDKVEAFYTLCKQSYPFFVTNPFWFFTLARLYILLDYTIENKIQNFIHIEYDNLIYGEPVFLDKLPKGIYFTQVGPNIGSAGFMCSNCMEATKTFQNGLLQLLIAGQQFLAKELKSIHLYEMEMIDYLNRRGLCKYLPLLPQDNLFPEAGFVFDGASYGQYLGGTNNGHDKGWFGLHHYVGHQLNDKTIEVSFDQIPKVSQGTVTANIFNLHIHNKNVISEFYNG